MLEATFVHRVNEFSAMEVCFSDLTEKGCPSSGCAIWCLPSATQTISDICVTFVVIANRMLLTFVTVKFWVFTGVSFCQMSN